MEDILNFKKFTAPIVNALQKMGVPAELSGRNDLLVDGRKISGNAIYSTNQGIVCHGTLLLNANLGRLSQALNVKPEKIVSKGIQSVRSRVANIIEFLPDPLEVEEFKQQLIQHIFEDSPETSQYKLTTTDWNAIQEMSKARYQTWDWNYGYSPEFNIQKVNRFPFGEIDARIDVAEGKIKQIHFFGDFFSAGDPCELCNLLIGVRYEPDSIRGAIQQCEISRYFGGLTTDEFVDFLY
jgi:lipoate-protein ligase A